MPLFEPPSLMSLTLSSGPWAAGSHTSDSRFYQCLASPIINPRQGGDAHQRHAILCAVQSFPLGFRECSETSCLLYLTQ